jgi:hypothetical protein
VRETRSTFSAPWSWRAVVFTTLLALLVAVAPAAHAANTITIDFSTVSPGAPFDQSSFKDDGIVFTEGTFVGFFQGDDALAATAARAIDHFRMPMVYRAVHLRRDAW